MVGVDHPDAGIVLFCQQSGVMLSEVVTVDQVDVPLLTEVGQLSGSLEVEAAPHLYPAAGNAHGFQTLYQQTAFVVSKIGLHTGMVQIADQRFHIPLRAGLSGIVQQIEDLHHGGSFLFSFDRRWS